MKNAAYIFFLLFLAACSDNVRVTGTVEGGLENGDSIFLMSPNKQKGADILSKSIVENGAFELSGNVELPAVCNVVTFTPQGRLARKMDFIAEGGDVEIKVLPGYYRVSGTSLNDAMQQVRDSMEIASRIYKRYYNKKAVSPNLSEMGRKEADDAMAIASYQYKGILYRCIESNIDNILAAYLIKNNIDVIEPAKGLQFIRELPAACKDNVIAYINKLYTAQERSAVGKPFIDIKMCDANGKLHALSTYAGGGTPLLINLWTSGSRASLDAALAVDGLQKELGDRVRCIGISIDTGYNTWRGAIENEGFSCVQLTDLKGWESDFMKHYGVDKAPYFVLVGGDGIIRYRGISFSDASSMLQELIQE